MNDEQPIKIIEETAPRVLTEREVLESEVLAAARERKHVNRLCWNHVPPPRQERVVTANTMKPRENDDDPIEFTGTPHVNPHRVKGTKAEKKAAKRARQEAKRQAEWDRIHEQLNETVASAVAGKFSKVPLL